MKSYSIDEEKYRTIIQKEALYENHKGLYGEVPLA